LRFLDFCVFKRIFGFPCPGCGMTRAWIALFKGELTQAFYYHPLFWTAPLLIAAIVIYIRKPKYKWNKILLISICILYIVVYVIRVIFGWRG